MFPAADHSPISTIELVCLGDLLAQFGDLTDDKVQAVQVHEGHPEVGAARVQDAGGGVLGLTRAVPEMAHFLVVHRCLSVLGSGLPDLVGLDIVVHRLGGDVPFLQAGVVSSQGLPNQAEAQPLVRIRISEGRGGEAKGSGLDSTIHVQLHGFPD